MNSAQQHVIKYKIGLLNLAIELGNISRACKVMGFSRDTFCRYQVAMEAGGVEALCKNRVEEATAADVTAFALKQPVSGQVRVSNELRKRGVFVSPSGVCSVWLRQNSESFKKRLLAPKRHVAETGSVLTEAQVQALEKKQEDNVAHGEIEIVHPGYLGSQDTFYVGTIKGVGRIYQHDTIPSGLPPSCIPPKRQSQPLICSMTECYRASPSRTWESHPDRPRYRILWQAGELRLPALSGVERHGALQNQGQPPQITGICVRFHKTILQKFYQVAFRRKIYQSIEEL